MFVNELRSVHPGMLIMLTFFKNEFGTLLKI